MQTLPSHLCDCPFPHTNRAMNYAPPEYVADPNADTYEGKMKINSGLLQSACGQSGSLTSVPYAPPSCACRHARSTSPRPLRLWQHRKPRPCGLIRVVSSTPACVLFLAPHRFLSHHRQTSRAPSASARWLRSRPRSAWLPRRSSSTTPSRCEDSSFFIATAAVVCFTRARATAH